MRDNVKLFQHDPVSDGSNTQITVNEPTSEPAIEPEPPVQLNGDTTTTDSPTPDTTEADSEGTDEEVDAKLLYDEGNMRKAIQMAQSA